MYHEGGVDAPHAFITGPQQTQNPMESSLGSIERMVKAAADIATERDFYKGQVQELAERLRNMEDQVAMMRAKGAQTSGY